MLHTAASRTAHWPQKDHVALYLFFKNMYPVESASIASVTVHILETDGTFRCTSSASHFTSLPLYTHANTASSKLFSTDLGLKPKHLFTLYTFCVCKLTHRQPVFNTAINNVSIQPWKFCDQTWNWCYPDYELSCFDWQQRVFSGQTLRYFN